MSTDWKLTIVESPYAGNVEHNLAYVRAAMADCLKRGESPYASHALLTQAGVLDDNLPEERTLGIEAGFAWGPAADVVAFYTDLGWSRGMKGGLERAKKRGAPRFICYRTLGAPWSDSPTSETFFCSHCGAVVPKWFNCCNSCADEAGS
jgi:hypothetical protein